MQRAIVFLALVACASAQLFQQGYDFRGNLQFIPAAGNIDGSIPFAGALAYLPTPEFVEAIRASSQYTQTIRPANGWILALDTRFGAVGGFAQSATVDAFYLIVAAASDNSTYREGELIVIASVDGNTDACYGRGVPLSLNGPTSSGRFSFEQGAPSIQGSVSCLIRENSIVAKLNFQASSRSEAPALGFQNFQYVRRDRTIFGPTVFTAPFAPASVSTA